MQEKTLLEMKIPSECISESSFLHLGESLNASGFCEESDMETGRFFRLAWFDSSASDASLVRARITAAALLAGVRAENICVKTLNSDWKTAWQADWKMVEAGKRLCVRPSFCAPPGDKRIDIVLDPGMAFGTGQHATTRLCLIAIERICDQTLPKSLLDMGCGSGLLAIAAAKLGIQHIMGVDNDPVAIVTARKNADINHVNIRFEIGQEPPHEPFDIVVANILARPLIEMAPGLAAATGQHLILSGVMESQIDDVKRSFVNEGLKPCRVEFQSEWASLELISPGKE
ncbi:MAG: 50S ribosomal protein L11 methyltransferase [Mariprofundaceae bacterium]